MNRRLAPPKPQAEPPLAERTVPYVPPTDGSVWAKENRDLPAVEEPKELVDLVKDDEFPLSLFYVQLVKKLEPALTRPSDAL